MPRLAHVLLLAGAAGLCLPSAGARAQGASDGGGGSWSVAPAAPYSANYGPPAHRSADRTAPVRRDDAVAPAAYAAPADRSPPTPAPLRLAPPSRPRPTAEERAKTASPGSALATTLTSLALVLAAFLGVVWIARRALPKVTAGLPREVTESLGGAALGPRLNVHVVRFGPKLLLVHVAQGGAETLSEITDPAEVERLAALCEQTKPGSATAAFRSVLEQLGREPARSWFGARREPARPASEEAA